ncbi:MAG: DUF4143 domain-containing protein [Candidatus Micrarchaeia archaeon]
MSTVESFGKYVIQSPYFSASKCLNFFKTLGYKIGKEKILQLEKYSQASYLFFFIPIFSYNIKDRSQYPRKAYAGDNGLPYSATGRMDYGRLYENLAFLELRRRTTAGKEICYWKNKDGLETDFIVKQGNHATEAIQVAYDIWDEKTRKREEDGLEKCDEELMPSKAIILTKDQSETKTVGKTRITIVPLMDWLLED